MKTPDAIIGSPHGKTAVDFKTQMDSYCRQDVEGERRLRGHFHNMLPPRPWYVRVWNWLRVRCGLAPLYSNFKIVCGISPRQWEYENLCKWGSHAAPLTFPDHAVHLTKPLVFSHYDLMESNHDLALERYRGSGDYVPVVVMDREAIEERFLANIASKDTAHRGEKLDATREHFLVWLGEDDAEYYVTGSWNSNRTAFTHGRIYSLDGDLLSGLLLTDGERQSIECQVETQAGE